MNILLLSQFFSTTRGGGEYVFSVIAKMLASKGHKVWIITNRILGEDYKEYNNIKVIFVEPSLEYKGGLPPRFSDNLRYSINTILKGFRIIVNEKIDIIHSNNFSPAIAGSILSYLTSKPHITTIHDIFSLCGKNYWKMWGAQSNVSKINVILAPFLEKLMTRLKHTCVHTVSESTRDDLLKFGEKKPIHVIHNTIDNYEENQIDPNNTQFVYVGRLVFYKNLEVIIKAIAIAKKEEPKIKLVIVGDGPHRRNLEKLVVELQLKSNIKFVGYTDKNEKLLIISKSIALVFPSLCEGFGLVILEAFSQKRPVLVSSIRPMSDIVTHGENGYVLDPHDQTIWANHLLRIIRNPEEGVIMGSKGKETLIKKYGIPQMYNGIIEMYNNVLGQN